MATATIVNHTDFPFHLQAMIFNDVQTVNVPPTTHDAPSIVMAEFIVWQDLDPSEIEVLYYTDNDGNILADAADIPPDQIQPPFEDPDAPPDPETLAANAVRAKSFGRKTISGRAAYSPAPGVISPGGLGFSTINAQIAQPPSEGPPTGDGSDGGTPTHPISGGETPTHPIELPPNGTTPPAPTAPPVNRDVPYLGGNGTVGSTLNCTMGNWDNEPSSYTYAWKSDGTTDLVGVGANYIVVASDDGHSITCVVTATNSLGSTTAPPSNAVAISGAAPAPTAPPVNRDVPYLGGTGTVGSVLDCTMGNWDNEPSSYAYQFKSDGTTDLTSTGNTYTVMPSDDNHSITCVVTATNALGSTAAPPSNAVAISGIATGLNHPLAAAAVIGAALTPGLPTPPPAARSRSADAPPAASAASAVRPNGNKK